MRSLGQAEPSETGAASYVERPEFAQILLQIDADRDADGVPTEKALVTAFILRYSETLLDPPFSPLLVVSMNAIIRALAKPDMAADARARLSELTWACYEALKTAKARSSANRAKCQRKRYRHCYRQLPLPRRPKRLKEMLGKLRSTPRRSLKGRLSSLHLTRNLPLSSCSAGRR